MTTTITYPFTTDSNYSFDSDKIEIVAGKAQLKLQEQQYPFAEDFADDTDFTYDSDKAEFSGGQVQQKNQKPADATFGANYDTNINGNWGGGTLTGTANGGASISGGKLDCTGETIKYVDYDADLNADSQQTGCLRFKLTPNYSGAPASVKNFFAITKTAGFNNNSIKMFQSSTLIFVQISDSAGSTIVSNAESWSPVSGTTYEIELNWDVTTGATRLFIDGTQLGPTQTGTGTRSSDIGLFRVGADQSATLKSDFYIDDFVVFSTVQHTANYTPGYTVSNDVYVSSVVTLPEMEHTNPGTLISFDSITSSEANSPRYTVQIGRSGDYLYWDGAEWAVSNGTYAQATSITDFNSHCTLLDVDGEIYGQFKVYFTDQSSQGSVDTLTPTLTANSGYPTDNPTVTPNSTFRTTEITILESTVTETGSDAVQFIMNIGGTDKWIDGAVATSNGTYAESSTLADFTTYIDSLVTTRTTVYPIIFLHSDDGSTTPSIDLFSITYNAAIPDPTPSTLCNLEGMIYDNDGPLDNELVWVRPFVGFLNDTILHKYEWKILATTDAEGHFSGDIYVQATSDDYWEIKVGSQRYKIQLPNSSEASLNQLTFFEVVEVE